MSDPQPVGGGSGDADSTDNLVDGTPGDDASDRGEQDATLTTDNAAQDNDDVVKPGNS